MDEPDANNTGLSCENIFIAQTVTDVETKNTYSTSSKNFEYKLSNVELNSHDTPAELHGSNFIDSAINNGLSLNKFCRMCANVNDTLIPIFESQGLEHCLAVKIEKHLPIEVKVEGIMPKSLCYQCTSALINWHNVYNACIEAEKKLRSLLNSRQNICELGEDNSKRNGNHIECENVDDDNNSALVNDSVAKHDRNNCDFKNVDLKYNVNLDDLLNSDNRTLLIVQPDSKCDDSKCDKQVNFNNKCANSNSSMSSCGSSSSITSSSGNTSNTIDSNFHKNKSETNLCAPDIKNSSLESTPTCSLEKLKFSIQKLARKQAVKDNHITEDINNKKPTSVNFEINDVKSEVINTKGGNSDNISSNKRTGIVTTKSGRTVKKVIKDDFLDCDNYSDGEENHIENSIDHISTGDVDVAIESDDYDDDRNDPDYGDSDDNQSIASGVNETDTINDKRNDSDDDDDCDDRDVGVNEKTTSLRKVKYNLPPFKQLLKIFCCKDCKIVFYNLNKYKDHQLTVHGVVENDESHAKEMVVDIKTEDISKKRKKKRVKKGSEEDYSHAFLVGHNSFVCTQCGQPFRIKQNLITHYRVKHDGIRKYKCHLCERAFGQSSNLKYHINSTHYKIRDFTCDICGKSFTAKGFLQEHVRIHTGETPFVCEVCGKSFKASASLNSHKRLVHSNERPYCCSVCGVTFKKLQGLKQHSTVHTGEKNYVCDICGKRFRIQKNLKRHKQDVHVVDNSVQYPCHICDQKFHSTHYLQNHIYYKHRNI